MSKRNKIIGSTMTPAGIISSSVDTERLKIGQEFLTEIAQSEHRSGRDAVWSANVSYAIFNKLAEDITRLDPDNRFFRDTSVITENLTRPGFLGEDWLLRKWETEETKAILPNREGVEGNQLKIENIAFTLPGWHIIEIDVERIDSGKLILTNNADEVVKVIDRHGLYFEEIYVPNEHIYTLTMTSEGLHDNEIVIVPRWNLYKVTDRIRDYIHYKLSFLDLDPDDILTTEDLDEIAQTILNTLRKDLDEMRERIDSHLDESNPHNITRQMLGAADAVHGHKPNEVGAAPEEHGHTPEECDSAPVNHNHTPEQCGAAPEDHTHTPEECGSASVDHTHTPDEAGAAAKEHTHSPEECGAAATNHTHAPEDIGAANATHTHLPHEIGASAIDHDHPNLVNVKRHEEDLRDIRNMIGGGVQGPSGSVEDPSNKSPFRTFLPEDVSNIGLPLTVVSHRTKDSKVSFKNSIQETSNRPLQIMSMRHTPNLSKSTYDGNTGLVSSSEKRGEWAFLRDYNFEGSEVVFADPHPGVVFENVITSPLNPVTFSYLFHKPSNLKSISIYRVLDEGRLSEELLEKANGSDNGLGVAEIKLEIYTKEGSKGTTVVDIEWEFEQTEFVIPIDELSSKDVIGYTIKVVATHDTAWSIGITHSLDIKKDVIELTKGSIIQGSVYSRDGMEVVIAERPEEIKIPEDYFLHWMNDYIYLCLEQAASVDPFSETIYIRPFFTPIPPEVGEVPVGYPIPSKAFRDTYAHPFWGSREVLIGGSEEFGVSYTFPEPKTISGVDINFLESLAPFVGESKNVRIDYSTTDDSGTGGGDGGEDPSLPGNNRITIEEPFKNVNNTYILDYPIENVTEFAVIIDWVMPEDDESQEAPVLTLENCDIAPRIVGIHYDTEQGEFTDYSNKERRVLTVVGKLLSYSTIDYERGYLPIATTADDSFDAFEVSSLVLNSDKVVSIINSRTCSLELGDDCYLKDIKGLHRETIDNLKREAISIIGKTGVGYTIEPNVDLDREGVVFIIE